MATSARPLVSRCAGWCIVIALLPGGIAAQTARPAKQPIGCLIGPEQLADIGTPVIGVVAAMNVDNGDAVQAGQALVVLSRDVEGAGVEAAELRARIDADVRAAEANLALATQRHVRAQQLLQQGFVSHQATEQARAEQVVAAQRLEQARAQKQLAARELGVVRAQFAQRTLRSPFDGIVTERFVNVGERVEDKPLMRLAMLDPLRVEIVVPASRYGSVDINDRLDIQPDLPNVAPVAATVTHVDRIIDAASNTFRVRLRLPNPGHKLPAGARCRVDLPGTAVASPGTPSRKEPAGTPAGKVSGQG
jgi:membrane fusion protein, heavy metal efflux system